MTVAFYSAKRSINHCRDALAERVKAIVRHGTLVDGPTVALLEQEVARYTGAAHAVAVNSGTDALLVMLVAAGVGPGDEVIVPAYTFIATASSVACVGATPVFVDVCPGSCAMDPAAVEAAVTERTAAIMPVHLFSQMADMPALVEISQRHGIPLFEDSAEAMGMRMDGVHAGLWGLSGILSFFPTKTLGALGDAGMILTNDSVFAARIRELARGDDAVRLGFASEMDEIQAAVLLERLTVLDEEIQVRAELAARYDQDLSRVAPRVGTPFMADTKAESANQVFYVYLIECDRRDDLMGWLRDRGIESEVYYPLPLNEQPCFTDANSRSLPTPIARRLSRGALGLPMYADLTIEQVDQVCDAITEFYEEH